MGAVAVCMRRASDCGELPISIIALKTRLASAPPAAIASVKTRGVAACTARRKFPRLSFHECECFS